MASYKLTHEAKEDLYRIWLYGLEKYGEIQADGYLDDSTNRFTQLAETPYLFPAVDEIHQGCRRSVCGVDSIYYRAVDEGVVIIRILGRQNADNLL